MLGATSSGEIVDFELTQQMDVETFKRTLSTYLPEGLPIYHVKTIDLKAPSATQAVDQAEYVLRVALLEAKQVGAEQWQVWIDQILATPEIKFEQTTKSGKKKVVNLRDRLFTFDLIQTEPNIQLHYIGSCCNDGNILRPEHLIYMLETVSGAPVCLRHIHRCQLIVRKAETDTQR